MPEGVNRREELGLDKSKRRGRFQALYSWGRMESGSLVSDPPISPFRSDIR